MSTYTIRLLHKLQEYETCVAMQEEVWGKGFAERVPVSILLVAQKLGGLVAGAFTSSDELVGFVFGLTGPMEGTLVHWSDMLGVHPSYRGKGIGKALKWFQRSVMLEQGIEYIFWTYEPLEARNARLNLHRLGATVYAYVPSMYPEHTGSPLHEGLGMDRFIVRWDLRHPRVEALARGEVPSLPEDLLHTPLLHPKSIREIASLPHALRVAIPADIQHLKRQNPEEARQWRRFTREVFQRYLPLYQVVDFHMEPGAPLGSYILIRKSVEP